jgi:site-specific DNA-methyltransferase (adenine-specific)/modification methylase
MQFELNKIYHEDCLTTMKKMPDNFVDLVFTSPPYNMNLRIRNGKYCSRQIVKEFSTKYEGFDDNLPIDDFYILHSKILNELLRVSKIVFYNIQIVTGSKVAFFHMIGDFAPYLKDIIVWDKKHGQPAMQSGVLNRRTELILIFEREYAISRQFKNAKFDRGTLEDIWCIGRGKKISKNHGATFPIELANKVMMNFTNKGDVIYDPFMGSGTTAVAAKQHACSYIGSEISEDYIKTATDRIAAS